MNEQNVAHIARLTLRRLKLALLRPHPRNPRQHPQPGSPEWETLKASLTHDYFDPLVVNVRAPLDLVLVSGHLRHKLLIALGFTDADCVVVEYDEPTHLARMLAANNLLGDNIEVDVRSILSDLKDGEVDLSLAGFTPTQVDSLLAEAQPPDDFPAYDENIPVAHKCPKCSYTWSGKPA